MQQSGQPPMRLQLRINMTDDLFHHDAVLGDREGVCTLRLAVPARDPCQAMRDVLDFDVER